MNETCTSIVSVLKNSDIPLSGTAIAKAIGKSKFSQICDDIAQLVSDGVIAFDDSGRFGVYSYIKVKDKESKKKESTDRIINADRLSDSSSDISEKYRVVPNVTNKSGQSGSRVVTSEGKKIFVKDGSSLLVINDVPMYIVSDSKSVIMAIMDYTKKNMISTFCVNQIGYGNIKDANDVSMVTVIDLNISKVNKAA